MSTLMKMCAASLTSMSNATSQTMRSWLSWSQKHRHSATCRRHGKCRFHYPRPPSPETVTAHQSTAATYPEEQAEQAVKALAAVWKILDDKNMPEDISMDELLLKANVSGYTYMEDMLHRKQCCYEKEAIRVLDQHLQSRCHPSVESQHGSAVHP